MGVSFPLVLLFDIFRLCAAFHPLAAMMKIQVIYVFTHDSILLGEDGPTHQPVEHLPSLRLIPNLLVIRPSDATEMAAAWVAALNHTDGPTALILSRQDIP